MIQSKTLGKGLGKGHGGNTSNLPVIRTIQYSSTVEMLKATGGLQPGTKGYRMGKAYILLSPPFEDQGWHMSISRPDHYPSWDEIAKAWYELVPNADNITGVMILPPKDEYVNIHNHCFHVHQLTEFGAGGSRGRIISG